MADQVYWDDVTEGMELPEVVKNPTTQQLVKYAGASGDYYQIHYDQSFARNNDLEDVILHGALKNAFLGYLVTKWMGQDGHTGSLRTFPDAPASTRVGYTNDLISRLKKHNLNKGAKSTRGYKWSIILFNSGK